MADDIMADRSSSTVGFTSWQPILDGKLAVRAWQAVRDIADGLADHERPAQDLALFWSYVSGALDDARTAERTGTAVERFSRDIGRDSSTLGLYRGLASTGWVAAHIAEHVDELLDAIDTTVLRALSGPEAWRGSYDLIEGLVGLAVYFLERGTAASATRGLQLIVDHLIALADRGDHGATWLTASDLVPPWQRATPTTRVHNCGLAHGVPGIVAVLARIADRADAPPTAAALRDDAARWIVAQDLGARGFPSAIGDGVPQPARTAWCYGDPGVTIALWRATTPGDGRDHVERLIDRWVSRAETASGVVDAGICHGAAGLAHICNRLYQASGNARYRDAARAWLERTLAYQRLGAGIGGFSMYKHQSAESPLWQPLPDFLDGAVGVGLVLLAAVTPIEPEWDRLLLCDLALRDGGDGAAT
jgi:lantibiotic modifying enzyme